MTLTKYQCPICKGAASPSRVMNPETKAIDMQFVCLVCGSTSDMIPIGPSKDATAESLKSESESRANTYVKWHEDNGSRASMLLEVRKNAGGCFGPLSPAEFKDFPECVYCKKAARMLCDDCGNPVCIECGHTVKNSKGDGTVWKCCKPHIEKQLIPVDELPKKNSKFEPSLHALACVLRGKLDVGALEGEISRLRRSSTQCTSNIDRVRLNLQLQSATQFLEIYNWACNQAENA